VTLCPPPLLGAFLSLSSATSKILPRADRFSIDHPSLKAPERGGSLYDVQSVRGLATRLCGDKGKLINSSSLDSRLGVGPVSNADYGSNP